MRTVELETGVEALAFGFSQDVREAVSDVEGYLQKCEEAEQYEVYTSAAEPLRRSRLLINLRLMCLQSLMQRRQRTISH